MALNREVEKNLIRCKKNERRGWKYGEDGTCFVGPGSKQFAINEGTPIGEIAMEEEEPPIKNTTIFVSADKENRSIDEVSDLVSLIRPKKGVIDIDPSGMYPTPGEII